MLKLINWSRASAERYNRSLPDDIRHYLKGRGIPATYIENHLLGWDKASSRITIPVIGRDRREILAIRYARPPSDLEGEPAMVADTDAKPQLYGWQSVLRKPKRIVICDNEFDRLVLEANGFLAVCSTAGAGVFLAEWAPFFDGIRHVYICFAHDTVTRDAAKRVGGLLPAAHIMKLPSGVRNVTEFFVTLRRTKVDFEVLLAAAAAEDIPDEPPNVREFRPYQKALQKRADRVKKAVPLHTVVEQYTILQASGAHLIANCPFHDDGERSFAVYPQTNTYSCSVCDAQGDTVKFLMDKGSLTYGQALGALERFEFTNELFDDAS